MRGNGFKIQYTSAIYKYPWSHLLARRMARSDLVSLLRVAKLKKFPAVFKTRADEIKEAPSHVLNSAKLVQSLTFSRTLIISA